MPDALKVCVISKADRLGGGASKVAESLVASLQEEPGIIAHHWMGFVNDHWPKYGRKLHGGRVMSVVRRAANAVSRAVGFPDFLTPEYLIHLLRREHRYDIYHLHDVSDTLSPLAIQHLASAYPVVWTLHDCSPFTGGCLYPMDCSSYVNGCGQCPQIAEWPQCASIDMTRQIRAHRRRIFSQPGLHAVTPSHWMADTCVASGATDTRPTVIPNAVDTQIYRPFDKETLRALHGIPADRFVLLLSSWSLDDRRKGIADILPALRELSSKPYLLMMGSLGEGIDEALDGFAYSLVGYIRDERLLSQYYACADAFLFPSRADNLPNAVLESMACGTPVLAYRLGGMPEMIHHGITGWLADPDAPADLVAGLGRLMDSPDLRLRMGSAARESVETGFSQEAFLDAHLALYQSVAQRRVVSG